MQEFLKNKCGGKWNGGLKCWIFPGSKKAHGPNGVVEVDISRQALVEVRGWLVQARATLECMTERANE